MKKNIINNNIVLIGLMGSGKTTLGKLIAEKSGMKFIDTDELILKEAGKSINKIFEQDGEGVFREMESEVIKEVSQKTGCVISTGGGAVLNSQNLDSLKSNGILFYLEASAEVLYERINNDSSRPLLKNDNPFKILENLLQERKKYYEKADYIINTENKSQNEIIELILYKHSNYQLRRIYNS